MTLIKANGIEFVNAGTVASLNKQLYLELKDVMSLPVNLVYQDKDIKGTAFALMRVNKEGKIELADYYDREILSKSRDKNKKISQRNR